MKAQLRPALAVFVSLSVITGVVYPLVVTAFAQLLAPGLANGGLIARDGVVVGSEFVGQPFDDPRYFWGRPSATGPVGYNGGASGGSNLGPTNTALIEAVAGRVEALRASASDRTKPIPVDLVTTSGSGLDPHVSPAAAEFQVDRVAKERGLPVGRVSELVAGHVEGRAFGVLGEPRVNVLKLNLALDALGR